MFNKYLVGILTVMLIWGGTLQAQVQKSMPQQNVDITVNDKELKRFKKAVTEIQAIQQQSGAKMQKAIKDAGMTVQRYQEIDKKNRSGGQPEFKEGEKQKYSDAQKKVQTEQQAMSQKMQTVLDDHNFKQQRFMEINKALRQDEELFKRFQKIKVQQSGSQMPQP